MVNLETTLSKKAWEAYKTGVPVYRDLKSNWFCIAGYSESITPPDWVKINEFNEDKLFMPIATKINTLAELVKFIANGGGACEIGPIAITKEEARAQFDPTYKSRVIMVDCRDESRFAIGIPGASWMCGTVLSLIFDGCWGVATNEKFAPRLEEVDFFESLKNPDAHRYNRKTYKTAKCIEGSATMDILFGKDWMRIELLNSCDIAEFAKRA